MLYSEVADNRAGIGANETCPAGVVKISQGIEQRAPAAMRSALSWEMPEVSPAPVWGRKIGSRACHTDFRRPAWEDAGFERYHPSY